MHYREPSPKPTPKTETFSQPVTLDEFLARPVKWEEYEVDKGDAEKLNNLFEETKKEFLDDVLSAISQGQLKIRSSRVKDRILKISLMSYDSKKNKLAGDAQFNVVGFKMFLDTQMLSLPTIQAKHSIYHELTHALIAGYSISKFKNSGYDMYEVNKNGISSNSPINPEEPDSNRGLKNNDINEAVTETIALLLLNKSDLRKWELDTDGSYLLEIEKQLGSPAYAFDRRNLARMVFKKDVPWTDFLDAYTEEDSENIYGERLNFLLDSLALKA